MISPMSNPITRELIVAVRELVASVAGIGLAMRFVQ